ncbi:MAG TPA: hypothetical protein VK541_17405 [Pedobacter sp.]|uniref:hypothetical protein n=1 Tax=Pedobacter sp. TaxID=1411316 RepID=UPI002C71F83E|nr:hypothetical protein [Pedobacter sp.]HMI04269.1 hypothetical protein [Pedobacter sp.]
MAQTIEYWQNIIIGQLTANGITVSGSRTSIRRIWTYVVAFCVWSLDVVFDLHKTEVSAVLSDLKPHTLRWYKNKGLAFQYGHNLITDSDQYDNTGFTDEQIEESRIIKYAAVIETENESRVIQKIATELDGVRQPLSPEQYAAFAAYMTEVKDAGVKLTIINFLPDRLYLSIQIFYNPLVLDAEGNSILDGGKPVEAAILDYMENGLDFNGELVLAHLIDRLQQVNGVVIPNLISAETSWVDGETEDYGDIQIIDVKKIPESGYFEIVNFENITYVPNV